MIDRDDDGGQAVVLLAISLPLVLALLLLVIDGGRLYVEREHLRNAAQLAAEAGVSLAADSPGVHPPDAKVRAMVRDALDRNLPGEPYTYTVAIPGESAVPDYNIEVHVSEPFHASIAALTFAIGAGAAAKLGGSSPAAALGASFTPSPPPPSSSPPTARPSATPSPTPSASPRSSVTILSRWHPGGSVFWCPEIEDGRGCFSPEVDVKYPPGTRLTNYYTDGTPGIGFAASPGTTHVYRVDFGAYSFSSVRIIESISVVVAWPMNGRPYSSAPYSVTVSR